MKTIMLTLGSILFLTPSVYAQSGSELFQAKCAACHTTTRPNDISRLVAPPVMGVMRHVKMTYANKEASIAFISDYAMNPHASKAVCMPQKIKRFGLMPSQKGNVSKAELQVIASWMYDNFGVRGQDRGNGQSCRGR